MEGSIDNRVCLKGTKYNQTADATPQGPLDLIASLYMGKTSTDLSIPHLEGGGGGAVPLT